MFTDIGLHSPWYLIVRNIKGKGRGILTTMDIKKGTIICKCPIIPLSFEDTDLASKTILNYYLFDYDLGKRAVVLGLGSLINHSDKPNSKWTIRTKQNEVVFWASRNIKIGEEITHNYNWDSRMWNGRSPK